MAGEDESPRRRDVLRTGAAAGLLGFAGLTVNGASAQETTTAEQETTTAAAGAQPVEGAFSFSLQEGDLFRVRFRPRDPFGEPATETVPGGCLDGESAEYQILIVRAFRDEQDLGYRSLLVPVQVLDEDTLGTTTAAGEIPETTEAAMQDETTTAAVDQETTPADDEETTPTGGEELPEIERGEWYRATSSEQCDGLYRLGVETAEQPETTPTGGETTTE